MRLPADIENLRTLRACVEPHDFVLVRERGEGASRARFQCKLCGGEVSEMAATHYKLGIVAGYRRGVRDGLAHAEQHYREAAAALVPPPEPYE